MNEINIWCLRPTVGGDFSKKFLEENIIGLGWDIPNLKKVELNRETLKELLKNNLDDYEGKEKKLALHAGMILKFAKKMKEGDIVIVPKGKNIHVAKIKSSYQYAKNEKCPHRKEVTWLKKNISRDELPENFNKSLQSRLSLYSIKNKGEIIEWMRENVSFDKIKELAPFEKLKSALYIEILNEYGQYDQTLPEVEQLELILNEYCKSLPQTVKDKAKDIANKSKVWLGKGTWPSNSNNRIRPVPNMGGEGWLDYIMNLVKEGQLEEKAKKDKEKIKKESIEELKNAVAKNDKEAIKNVLSDLEDKEDLVEDLYDEVVEKVKEQINNKEKDNLFKIAQAEVLVSNLKNLGVSKKELQDMME